MDFLATEGGVGTAATLGGSGDWVAPGVGEIDGLLDGYRVTGLIGRGGMGAVYRAVQVSLGREVAIKVLPPPDGEDVMRAVERFENEARTLARLEHPGIVAVYDFGEAEDGAFYYLVMEYVEGGDVAGLLGDEGRLPAERAMEILRRVCAALECAHSQGVVHRDIKPSNLLVDRRGRVKVADFGLATMGGGEASLMLTRSNVSLGTPGYAAPEVRDPGGEVDVRADVYSVGVLLYEMLTGELPRGMFKMPSEMHPELDGQIDGVVCRAMEAERDERFGGLGEMLEALELPDEVEQREWRPRWAALVLLVIAGCFMLGGQGDDGRTSLLAGLDVEALSVMDGWRMTDDGLRTPESSGTHQMIELPVAVAPAEYDLRVELTRHDGMAAVVIGFMRGERAGFLEFDAMMSLDGPFRARVGSVSGAQETVEYYTDAILLGPDVRHTVVLEVREESVRARLDGEELIAWEADWDLLLQDDDFFFPEAMLGRRAIFGVGACATDVTFHRVELVPAGRVNQSWRPGNF